MAGRHHTSELPALLNNLPTDERARRRIRAFLNHVYNPAVSHGVGRGQREPAHVGSELEVLRNSRWSRRTVLRGGAIGLGGIATAALIGCDSDDEEAEPASTTTGATATGTAAPAGDIEYPGGQGELVESSGLPFPYNFPEPAKAPKAGGVMAVGATWDVGPMDPAVSAAGGTVVVPNMVYNRLLGIKRGPGADVFDAPILEPELAESWERSPDGLTFTFKIRSGITWQNLPPLNGRAFVAEDAAFALNRYATEGVHQQYYVNVESIEAVDDATLKVTMARPAADFLNPLGSNKQTIFPRELVDDGSIESTVVGTGPMILKEAAQGSHVKFDKNPDFWEREVLLDGFEFKMMPDHATRLAAFRAEQIGYAYSAASSMSDIDALKKTNPDIQVNLLPATSSLGLAMNLTLPKFADERVRRAISLSVDRDAIIEIINEGYFKVLGQIPWPLIFDNEPTAESGELGNWLRLDIAEAKQLLSAAGAEGLTLDNAYFAYNAAFDRLAELLVPQFREAGITMTGGKVDYTQFNSQWVGGTLPEFTTGGWATSGFDPDNWFYGQVHSTSTGNRWRINDPEIDEWALTQQVELDPEARKEIWRKIWDKDLDMAYRPPIYSYFFPEIYQPWVRGLRWTGTSPGDNASYYNWGDQVQHIWLDK